VGGVGVRRGPSVGTGTGTRATSAATGLPLGMHIFSG